MARIVESFQARRVCVCVRRWPIKRASALRTFLSGDFAEIDQATHVQYFTPTDIHRVCYTLSRHCAE
jgi:hypothetical protein